MSEEACIHYAISVGRWDHAWGISVGGRGDWDDTPYSELATLKFSGKIIRPEAFKYPKAEVTLSGRHGMLPDINAEAAKSVGMLNAHGDILGVYAFVPAERVGELLTLAASGRVQAITMLAEKLRYRKASLHHINLETDFDVEEL